MSDEQREDIRLKLKAIDYCLFGDAFSGEPAWEDATGNVFDMLEIFRFNIAQKVPEFDNNDSFISHYSGAYTTTKAGRRRRLLVKKYGGTITPDEKDELDKLKQEKGV